MLGARQTKFGTLYIVSYQKFNSYITENLLKNLILSHEIYKEKKDETNSYNSGV